MLSKMLVFALLITARINFIVATIKYESDSENENDKYLVQMKSPSGIEQLQSGTTAATSFDAERMTIETALISDSNEELSVTSEALIPTELNPEEQEKLKKHEMKKFLKSVDPDTYYNLSFTSNDYLPAYKAVLRSDMERLRFLETKKVNFDNFDAKTGETPFHAACRRGNEQVFMFIHKRIKNFSPLNRAGRTPFSVAVSHGNGDLVLRMLQNPLKYGCKLPDNMGRTPVMIAALSEQEEIFKLLISLGHNYLQLDNSGRSLLSLMTQANPNFNYLLELIMEDLTVNRQNTIRAIAADISYIYMNENLGGKSGVNQILSKLGMTLEEMITTPQEHSSNPLMAILESKDYVYYRRIEHDPVNGFDTNSSNEFDKFTFIERCLQVGSLHMIDYILRNRNEDYVPRLGPVFMSDRVEILEFLSEKFPRILSEKCPVKMASNAEIYGADKCFEFLINKYQNVDRKSFICEVAEEICNSYNAKVIMQFFRKYGEELKQCDFDDLEKIQSILDYVDDYDFGCDEDWREFKSVLRYFNYKIFQGR